MLAVIGVYFVTIVVAVTDARLSAAEYFVTGASIVTAVNCHGLIDFTPYTDYHFS